MHLKQINTSKKTRDALSQNERATNCRSCNEYFFLYKPPRRKPHTFTVCGYAVHGANPDFEYIFQ